MHSTRSEDLHAEIYMYWESGVSIPRRKASFDRNDDVLASTVDAIATIEKSRWRMENMVLTQLPGGWIKYWIESDGWREMLGLICIADANAFDMIDFGCLPTIRLENCAGWFVPCGRTSLSWLPSMLFDLKQGFHRVSFPHGLILAIQEEWGTHHCVIVS